MIESIQFKNFKCLRDATLPLSPCTILVGPNGSGKTTVLQALEAFSNQRKYHFDQLVTASLRADQSVTEVEVVLRWGEPHAGAQPMKRWLRGGKSIGGNKEGTSGANLVGDLLAGIRTFSLDARRIAESVPVETGMELGADGACLAGVLTHIRNRHPERFAALNHALTLWLPEYDQVMLDYDDNNRLVFSLRVRHGHHEIVAHDLSQGTLLTLAVLTLAYLPSPPPLIGLEEPDRGVHPHLLRLVRDALYRLSNPEGCGEQRPPVQVIATTHSPTFLNLFAEYPEDVVVCSKVGLDVQFQRISDQEHFREKLGDAPLGDAWFTGFFGGVPAES